MLEGKLSRSRLELGDPIRQVGCRVEPGRLRNPLQVDDRPEVVAPKRRQFEATRCDRLGVRYDVAAALGEVFDLKIRADQKRRILLQGSHHFLARDHGSTKAPTRTGEVTGRPDDMSSTPGRSQSPSG